MFFRPNFCANCGEKIERSDWGIFTSRRFCPVCESEFKGQDLIPRFIVGVGLLACVFGFGSYFKSGAAATNQLAIRPTARASEQSTPANLTNQQPVNVKPVAPSALEVQSSMPQTMAALPPSNNLSAQKPEMAEPKYFCGAETKKGTPCTRRVKGNTRCFQHKGMPAMVPPEKLKIG